MSETSDPTITPAAALTAIAAEVVAAATALSDGGAEQLESVASLLADADRVFVHGAGRSGLALQMTAMRLMHLGLRVHVVGDATTPAIAPDDVLLTASGSGTTGGIVRAAQNAVDAGARVVALTTAADSPLAALASAMIVVPAADKLDRSGRASAQYSGGLFEQVVVVTGDALFHALWKRSGLDADDLWPRHANLE
ncbi:6-phospho-3-hexuloisomerase [Rathayibacter iranicus]|uniref:SIS domain-containing protein n=2 Tax=Rathayibacter iranicus TaxID=59737 RepID=A0AAD1EMT5_9MICO|nr:6-phospho-3-hexuloisomerase [Rathayibacter iranicus]AZZ56443.1 SIS domain-containing protein [Rathayibacter iranicus]MWV31824.1 SIS domain-containing protein [Rathayibacter iranicus NCPPB 2253 = VKM Ac-1602]PPI44694.1 6-phospho-3-hexuloisomerase [Rathayibacter iranicus]PPI59125.1 6-phospho-3-hexuloisomerase [Rathayibacter iranicus]PPI70342.1 6-phospho-3-hexuloisomerase [Rathayibacter iranicus]